MKRPALWQSAKKLICFGMAFVFAVTSIGPSYAQSVVDLPKAGTMVNLSQGFAPVVLRGMKVDPNDPFKFEFVLDPGQSGLQGDALKDESTKLIRYFLASVTTPEKDLWVNLSPYEQDRIIPEAFGTTEMGRDLLSQDYILKQVTSSLMYPEGETGKVFWAKVYAQAYDTYGTTDVPVDTFNKVWITPDMAEVYEDNGIAFIGKSHLKVMLESDYVAASRQTNAAESGDPARDSAAQNDGTAEMTKQLIREVMLPVIEKEVNEGRNFAPLRQVYQSLILAAWYKKRLKESVLSKVYADRNKVAGVDITDKKESEKIWAQYVASFKKGAYNYIKEEVDQYTQELIPRKYFSGGCDYSQISSKVLFDTILKVPAALLLPLTFIVGMALAPFSGSAQESINPVEIPTEMMMRVQQGDGLTREEVDSLLTASESRYEVETAFLLINERGDYQEGFHQLQLSIMSTYGFKNMGEEIVSAYLDKGVMDREDFLEFLNNANGYDFLWFASLMKDHPAAAEIVKRRFMEMPDSEFIHFADQFADYGPEMNARIKERVEGMDLSFTIYNASHLIPFKEWAAAHIDRCVRHFLANDKYVIITGAGELIDWVDPVIVKDLAKTLALGTFIYKPFDEYPWFLELLNQKAGALDVNPDDVVKAAAVRGLTESKDVKNRKIFLNILRQKLPLASSDVSLGYLDMLLGWDGYSELSDPGDQKFRDLFINRLKDIAPHDAFRVMETLLEGASQEQRAQVIAILLDKIRMASIEDMVDYFHIFPVISSEIESAANEKIVALVHQDIQFVKRNIHIFKETSSLLTETLRKMDMNDVLDLGSELQDTPVFFNTLKDRIKDASPDQQIAFFIYFFECGSYVQDILKESMKVASLESLLSSGIFPRQGWPDGRGFGQSWIDLARERARVLLGSENVDADLVISNADVFMLWGEEGERVLIEKAPHASLVELTVAYSVFGTYPAWYLDALSLAIARSSLDDIEITFSTLMMLEADTRGFFKSALQERIGQLPLSLLLRTYDFVPEWYNDKLTERLLIASPSEVLPLLDSWDAFRKIKQLGVLDELFQSKASDADPRTFFESARFMREYPWFPDLLKIKAEQAFFLDVILYDKEFPGEIPDNIVQASQDKFTRYIDNEGNPSPLFFEEFIPFLLGEDVFKVVESTRRQINMIEPGKGNIFIDRLTSQIVGDAPADSLDVATDKFQGWVHIISAYVSGASSVDGDVAGIYYANAAKIGSVIYRQLGEPAYAHDPMADSLRNLAGLIISQCRKELNYSMNPDAPGLVDARDVIDQIDQEMPSFESSFDKDNEAIIELVDPLLKRLKGEEPLNSPAEYRDMYSGMIDMVRDLLNDSLVSERLLDTAGMHKAGDFLARKIMEHLARAKKEWDLDQDVFDDMQARLEALGYDVTETETDLQKLIRNVLEGNFGYLTSKLTTRFSNFADKHQMMLMMVLLLASVSILKVSGSSQRKKQIVMAWMALVVAYDMISASDGSAQGVQASRSFLSAQSREDLIFVRNQMDTIVKNQEVSGTQDPGAVTSTDPVVEDYIFQGKDYHLSGSYRQVERSGMSIPNHKVRLLNLVNSGGREVARITRLTPDSTAGIEIMVKPGQQGKTGISKEVLERNIPQGAKIFYEAVVAFSALGGSPLGSEVAMDGKKLNSEPKGHEGMVVQFSDGSVFVGSRKDLRPSDLTRKKEKNNDRFDFMDYRSDALFWNIVESQKLSVVNNILLAYKGKIATFRADDNNVDRRRAICFYRDGSIAFLDPIDDVNLARLSELAMETGTPDNPLEAAVYCDTGSFDFARLYTYDADGKMQVEVLGHADADKSNNRAGLWYIPVKTEGQKQDTVLSYRFSGPQDSTVRRIHPEVFEGQELVGIVRKTRSDKEVLQPAAFGMDKYALLYEVKNAILNNNELVVLVRDVKTGKDSERRFVTSDAAESKDVDNAGVIDGGIDLNPAGMKMSIKGDGSAAINAFDPAMFEQLQSAPGFVPVILGVTPVNDLPSFLGISRTGAMDPEAVNS